jgi:Ca2+/Na+ antiporter
MQTTFLIIIIAFLVLCVLYLYGLNRLRKEIHKSELESKDMEIEHLTAHKKFHEDYFFKLEAEKK